MKFICDYCEYKNLAFSKTHKKSHMIVRVSEVEEEDRSTTEQFQFLGAGLAKVKGVFAEIKQNIGTLAGVTQLQQ